MSAEALVNIDESLALPLSISCAFDRNLSVLAGSDAFVDRVLYLSETVSTVLSWRWADVITGEQCAYLLRRLRKEVQDDLGAISKKDGESASALQAREIAHAEWEAEREELRASSL